MPKPPVIPKFMALPSVGPELLPTEVLYQCGDRKIRIFLLEIADMLKFSVCTAKFDADDAETHFLAHYGLF